jgi:hypothetical protein
LLRVDDVGDHPPPLAAFTVHCPPLPFPTVPPPAGDSDDLLDAIPVTPVAAAPPPLLDGGRVTGGMSTSVTRGAGASLGPEAGSHLSSLDLAAALQASTIAGVLPTLQAQQRAGGLEGSKSEPHFLHHERRGLWGQAAYNIGYSYFGGLAVGGAWLWQRRRWWCEGRQRPSVSVPSSCSSSRLRCTPSLLPMRSVALPPAGFVGFLSGLRKSPNNSPRVLLNSVLNGSGKFGARAGNAAGVLAMVYTGA